MSILVGPAQVSSPVFSSSGVQGLKPQTSRAHCSLPTSRRLSSLIYAQSPEPLSWAPSYTQANSTGSLRRRLLEVLSTRTESPIARCLEHEAQA